MAWMYSKNKLRNSSSQGQGLVEFALVLPLLLLILFGVLDLGRIFATAITVTNAAREGARYISLHPDDLGGVVGVVQAEGFNSGIDIDGGDIHVSCTMQDGECVEAKEASVEVTYSFDLILGWIFPEVEITRSVRMLVQ